MQVFGTFSVPAPEGKQVTLHPLTKNSLETSDSSVLATVLEKNVGDIAVITTLIGEEEYQKSSYMWTGSEWEALNGNVEADKVILTDNITMAGNYTQFGNLTKTQTGTSTFNSKGKTLMEALTEILSKRLQPKDPTPPSLGNVTISKTGLVEAGTTIPSINVSKVTFNPGSYEYGPATGVTASSWKVERIANTGTVTVEGAGEGGVVTDNNSGSGFKIGDQGSDIKSISYKVTAEYTEGAVANDNLGSPSSPPKRISAGSTSKSSGSINVFRKYFYGTDLNKKEDPDSAYVRALTGSTAAARKGTTFSITIPEGTKTVMIAYPSSIGEIASVKDSEAFGTDIVANFKSGKKLVNVEGAEGYTAIEYNVYIYAVDVALGKNRYDVTI